MTTVLVLGGVRSGKSRYAELLLRDRPAVRYVAPGPVPDAGRDPEWAARVAAHQAARPPSWTTVETPDVPDAVASATGDVMVDCLGTWLTRIVDDAAAWDDRAAAGEAVDHEIDSLVAALHGAAGHVVLVSNEVGLGVVPEHASGRLFRDLLGRVNARTADACDHVRLVVAGRVLDLGACPTVDGSPRLL